MDKNEEPDDSSSKSEPEGLMQLGFCGVYMLWSINLGQSVLVPYQLSASSYATALVVT